MMTFCRVILRDRSEAPVVILRERSERKDRYPYRDPNPELPWLESDPLGASRRRMTRRGTNG